MATNLSEEFEAPATAAAVDLSKEFEAPKTDLTAEYEAPVFDQAKYNADLAAWKDREAARPWYVPREEEPNSESGNRLRKAGATGVANIYEGANRLMVKLGATSDTSAADNLRNKAEAIPIDPTKNDTVTAKGIDMVGQLAPVMLTGPAAAVTGGLQMGGAAAHDAKQAGATVEEQNRRFNLNFVGGTALNMVPIPGIKRAGRFIDQAAEQIVEQGKREAVRKTARAVTGAALGGVTQVAGGAALQKADTGEIDLGSLLQQAAMGAGVGVLHSGAGSKSTSQAQAVRDNVLLQIRQRPEFKTFAGDDNALIREVHAKLAREQAEARAAKMRNVTPEAGEQMPEAGSQIAEIGSQRPEGGSRRPVPLPEDTVIEFMGTRDVVVQGSGSPVPQWQVRFPGEDRGRTMTAASLAAEGWQTPEMATPQAMKEFEALAGMASKTTEATAARPAGVPLATVDTPAPAEPAALSGEIGIAPTMSGDANVRDFSPVFKAKDRRLKFGPSANENVDIIDAIQGLGGVPRKPADATGGEWNGHDETFSGRLRGLLKPKFDVPDKVDIEATAAKLYPDAPTSPEALKHARAIAAQHAKSKPREGRGRIDIWIKDELAATYPQFAHLAGDPDGFRNEVLRALGERDRIKRSTEIEQQQGGFMEAALEGKGRAGRQKTDAPVPVGDLTFGTEFKIKREPFRVTDINPDDGSVTVEDGQRFGTQILPSDALLYPDKGTFKKSEYTPAEGDVFEPATPWKAGLKGSNRYRELSTKSMEGQLTPRETAELAGFEAQAGQQFVPGSMDAMALESDAAQAAADKRAKDRAAIEARANARLVGGQLEVQSDLLGTAPGETGMLFEPSEAMSPENEARPKRIAVSVTRAMAIAKAEIVDRPIANRETGIVATVSNKSLDKMGSSSAINKSVSPQWHALAVANVDQLFGAAELLESGKDGRPGDGNLKEIHRFYAPMVVADQVVVVKMTVKEFARASEGNRLYSVEAIDVEKVKPAGQLTPDTAGKGVEPNVPLTGFNEKLRAMVDRVKPQGGMLFEPTDAALIPFFERAGIENQSLRADALRMIGNALHAMSRFARAPFYEMPAAAISTSRATLGNVGALAEASPWLTDPIKYAGELADVLREHGRISSIVADYFSGQLPAWSPIGKTIASPQDVVALMAPLRTPYTESFKAVVLDQANRVVHAEVLHVGDLTSSAASVQSVIRAVGRAAGKTASRRVLISHNHPSGDPSPSTADWVLHERMKSSLSEVGIVLVDDVVTNGHAGYSLTKDALFDMKEPVLAPWERISRANLKKMSGAADVGEIAAVIRQSNPEAAFAIYLNNRNRITAIEQLPSVSSTQLTDLIIHGSAREGSNGLVLGGNSFADDFVGFLGRRLKAHVITLHDVSTEDTPSWAAEGRLKQAKAPNLLAAERRVGVQEDTEPFDPASPLLVTMGNKGLYVKVPLTRLNDIPIVQMPELVRLTRELTGQLPDIKKLRGAAGHFKTGTMAIRLDPRIFRDSSAAAKTLAHEIGHLIDYLPQKTMARGNLLGRIASLRNFLRTTLPLDPKAGQLSLAPADRRRLRTQAEKQVGGKPPKDEEADLAAWREEVAGKYAELLQQEMETRGLIVEKSTERGGTTVAGVASNMKGVREELIGLTEYWKPIPENAPESYHDYRMSSEELYADALSVLLNSPATLKELAPTFYQAFFNYLDRKPEVKANLLGLYQFLNKPHLQTLLRRSEDIRAMFVKGDEIILRTAEERRARYATFRGWNDRFRQELFDVFDPLVHAGAKIERKGVTIPDRFNPRMVFDEHPLADNANYEMMQHLWEKVVKPVEADGFTLHDLGEYLYLQRVLNERFEVPDEAAVGGGRSQVANPLGMTPETARLGLLRMRLDAGWQRFARMEIAADKFHDVVFEVVGQAVEVGAYSRKTFDERLAPNKRYYVAFAVLDYLQDYVPAGIKLSQGTFKEIANPFTATILKMVSLNRLIQLQKSKRGTVEFLQTFDPVNIVPAEARFDGKRFVVEKPKDPDRALLELLADGRPAGYHVDPAVAEMFEKLTPAWVSAVTTVINWPFRKLIYPLIIQYNPAFQLVLGPTRDLRRTLVNVPKGKGIAQVGEFVRNYVTFLGMKPTEAGAAVRAYLRGEPHPLIAEMIATQAIGTPLDNFARDYGRADPMEKILADYGLLPKNKANEMIRMITKPVASVLEQIEFAGLSFEMLPKVTTYKMLTRELGWSTKEAAYFVRNSIGVPNIYRKGKHTLVAESVIPFTKVFVNGLRADARLATSPKTAGGWWLRWAASGGAWKMLQAAGALGLLGAGIKELYDGISEYNKTNYLVLPIGTSEGGEFGKRVVYIRIPEDETQRLMSGLLYQGMMLAGGEATKQGLSSMLAFGADQTPGLNPILKIGNAWKDYLEGDNPADGFRGKPVLSNAEWLAGGWPSMKGMFAFTADNVGLTNFVRWDAKANSWQEMTLSAVPGINRFVQTTATGYRERQEAQQQKESAERAKLRLAMPENVQRLAGEYYHLRSVKADLRTPEQTMRLMELSSWHKRVYQPFEDLFSVDQGKPDPGMLKQLGDASTVFERGK